MNIRPPVLSPYTNPANTHPKPVVTPPAENTRPSALTGPGAETSGPGQKPSTAPTPNHELDFAKGVIYGSITVPPPTASYTQQERLQRVDAFAGRVVTQIKNIESGEEGESNIRFQKTRQFMEPAGYFSGGLLAAGLDPHEKITVTFNSYVGKWKPEVKTNTDTRTYFAWEIAAGALKHDRPAAGGLLNFQTMEIKPEDRSKINDLEALGKKLQDHWKDDIAKPMSDKSGALAKRSGKADAYVVKGTLQSLRNDKAIYKALTPEGRAAIDRTLDKNGNVVIPNIYGYPLAGYAFIPYVNYHGDYDTRPNQGLMIDLKNGTVSELKGDDEFARWAKNNREALLASFNGEDKQGGKDAHWPPASTVLDNLIAGNHAHYPGRHNLLSDKQVSVRETFNYTQSRKESYYLNFGDLKSGIARDYQEINANNAKWADQTQVFGSSQQTWKEAKELWGRTFGYVPVLGNAGNIYFGIHDSIYGKTAEDRVGGTAAAVISSLQLVHEITPAVVEAGLGDIPTAVKPSSSGHYSWKYNELTTDFELVRKSQTSNDVDTGSAIPASAPSVPAADKPSLTFAGMREVEFRGKAYFAADEPDALDGTSYLLRVQDPKDPTKLVSSGIVAKPDAAGVWKKIGVEGGGKWFWDRTPSPTLSDDLKSPPSFANQFLDLEGKKITAAERVDEFLKINERTHYEFATRNYEENGKIKSNFNVSWKIDETDFSVEPGEKARVTEHSTSEYSPNFVLDVNRNTYIVTRTENGLLSTAPLDAVADSAENIRKARLRQFEDAIPDADLRARISEVAHQGSIAPAIIELNTDGSMLQEGYRFGADDTQYHIEYDSSKNEAKVQIISRGHLNNGDLDIEHVPGVEVTIKRTFTIREGNELDSAYTIDSNAPSSIEVTVKPQPEPENKPALT